MKFLNDTVPPYDLTYDDVFMVPSRSAVGSRQDVDLATPDGTGTTVPLVVANMTAIAGRRMAETVARRGGLAVIPQDIPIDVVAEVVSWVKRRHLVLDTPITLAPSGTVADALALLPKRAHGAAVVVSEGRPVGLVTESDLSGVDRFTQVSEVMSRDLLLLDAAMDPREAFNRLDSAHRKTAPAVDGDGKLVGILTRKGALRATLYTPATDDRGRLRIAAAVGVNGDVAGRAKALLDAGTDALVVDTAHGHQEQMMAALRAVRELAPAVPVVVCGGQSIRASGIADHRYWDGIVVVEDGTPWMMCTTGGDPGGNVHPDPGQVESSTRSTTRSDRDPTPAVPNLLNRDFHASAPNTKWLTDLTEIHIPAGKVYVSPIVDCFDGLVVAWNIGTSPDANLVNTMLDHAVRTLRPGEHPVIHSDRGSHYRWPAWIRRTENAQLTRSMSKKGCSPDNAACEGFFGRLKTELIYPRNWQHVTLKDLMTRIDAYIHWYNERRIKVSLGGRSPIEYRHAVGLMSV
jgi:IMP dehydrogenase/GMP reductase